MQHRYVMLVVASAFSFLAPSTMEDCNGCQIIPGAEDLDDVTDSAGCKINLWAEVSGFTEDCGAIATACNQAGCSFGWRVKYKTSGTCTGNPFVFKRLIPVGSDMPLPVSATARTIVNSPKEFKCGQFESYHYKAESANDPNVFAEISGTLGCGECSQIVP